MAVKKNGGKKGVETGAAKTKEKSWYSTGKQGMANSKREDEAAKQRREQRKDMPWRFRLDSNEENVKGTFLDNPQFFLREHNLKIAGKFGNYLTCLSDFDTCPLCTTDNSSYILVGTIIDHREITGKEQKDGSAGKVYKNMKRLFVAKGKAREKIVRKMEDKGSLQYCVFNFSRGSSQTECGTGEQLAA